MSDLSKLRISGTDYDLKDAQARSDITALNGSLENVAIKKLSEYKKSGGAIGTSTWTNPTSAQYKHVAIPVTAGDVVQIASSNTSRCYAIVTDAYTPPTGAGSIPFSAELTSRQALTAGIKTFTVPSDGAYLIIDILYSGTAVPITVLKINDYNLLVSTSDNIKNVVSDVGGRLLESTFLDGYNFIASWYVGSCGTTIGQASQDNTTSKGRRRTGPHKCPYPLTVDVPDRKYKTTVILLDDDLIVRTVYQASLYQRKIPKNTYFKIILQDAVNDSKDLSGIPSSEIRESVLIKNTIVSDLLESGLKARWIAMGDSITLGWHSEFVEGGGTDSEVSYVDGWAYKVRLIKNWSCANVAVGSTGFLEQGNAGANDKGYVIARNTNFANYDIVTIAYGINDWKGNNTVGTLSDDPASPTTVIGAMKATIEAIFASNPHCKVVGILPINAWGYSHNYGSKATNYGLGYEFSKSGTLESFVGKLKEMYEYYGIEYIDLTHASVVNRENLPTLLPDGVHPSAQTHTILAREIASKLNF